MALFGRKKSPQPAGTAGGAGGQGGQGAEDQKSQPGHQAVLRHLAEKEKSEPWVREQLAGRILYDFAYELLKDDRGVRISNLLAMLASVGGQECIGPIIRGAPENATMEQLGLTVIKGNDGRFYFFGDAPNRLLVESSHSLLSLVFGAAQALGAPVTMEMITDEMRLVAQRAGGPDFETLDLPPENMVDRPTEWVRVFRGKVVEALDLYDVPETKRATAIGYALYRAIEGAKDVIDPLLAAKIVLQCATRTAKLLLT